MGTRSAGATEDNLKGRNVTATTMHKDIPTTLIPCDRPVAFPQRLVLGARVAESFNRFLFSIGIIGSSRSRICSEEINMDSHQIRRLLSCSFEFLNRRSQFPFRNQGFSIEHMR